MLIRYPTGAVNAEIISLFIPDAQGQSLSVDDLGTDADGHTTWAIGIAGADTLTVPSGLPGIGTHIRTLWRLHPSHVWPGLVATMVAGPTDLHLVEDVQSALGGILRDDCGIKDGVAVCTIALSSSAGVSTVAVITQNASAFEVQIATAPTAPSTGSTQGAGASATESAHTTIGTTSTTTNSGGPSAQTANAQNGTISKMVAKSSWVLAMGSAAGIAFTIQMLY